MKLFVFIISWLFAMAFFYLSIGFVAFDIGWILKAGTWEPYTRFVFLLFAGFVSFVSIGVAAFLTEFDS